MGRKEFMEQLAALLGDISPQEREEALDYYERYFDEAGDALQQGIHHLGSPQKVAQDIKSGLKGEYFYTENGAESAASDTESKTPAFYVEEEKKGDRAKASAAKWSFWSWWEDQNTIMRVIWFALALAILIPAAGAVLGTATGLLGGLIGIVVGIFGLIIGILAGALGIMIAAYIFGAVSIVYGAVMLFVNPFRGLMSLGLGCIGLAVGIFMTFLCIWLYLKMLPVLIRMAGKALHKIFSGRSRMA